MYRCIAKLEIDLEGLGEFYSKIDEYETLNMYQIISTWLQDDLDGPNPENTVFGVSEYALDWMLCYLEIFLIVIYLIWEVANLVIVLKVLIIYMLNFYKHWKIRNDLNLNMNPYTWIM